MMDSILRFASSLSNVENFARDVYIKSNLTIELDRVIKQLVMETDDCSSSSSSNVMNESNRIVLTETPTVSLFCDILEAILLHGFKGKLSSRVQNVFSNQPQRNFSLNYWPMISILCHTEEARRLKRLKSISTDIGRCRAWLRSALNESLFRSYLDTLICDSSLLNSFYRSSAYIRDSQHTEIMRQLIVDLEKYVFQLNIDNVDLNCWSNVTLKFLGVNLYQTDDSLVVTALDAIHLISEDKAHKGDNSPKDVNFEPSINEKNVNQSNNIVNQLLQQQQTEAEIEEAEEEKPESNSVSPDNVSQQEWPLHEQQYNIEQQQIPIETNSERQPSGNSLTGNIGWSTQPVIHDESYDAILESYSSRTVLSSTPDLDDVRHLISFQSSQSNNANYSSPVNSDNDFEIIPKSEVIDNSSADNQKFFETLRKLAQEQGLDQQDYKCHLCLRPIGMIYGKSRLCAIDGCLYCTECNTDDEYFVPAQIIYNWNFRKFPTSRHNKKRLQSIESEPIFDIKQLSPLLYSAIDEMAEVLDLRTQLFFLHAYLFTCQENVALKMRKLVWPREHLFEHIHLYSLNDLLHVHNNTLAPLLRQVIAFARKHVFNCSLCKLKGYYCEICKGSQILYPFDTDSTRRCENCKSVFHLKCYEEKYDKYSCPKCVRLSKKQSASFLS